MAGLPNSEENQANGNGMHEEDEIEVLLPSIESLASSDAVVDVLNCLSGIRVVEPSPVIKQLYEQIVDNLTTSERYEMIATLHQYYTGKLTLPGDPSPPNEYVRSAWNTYLALNARELNALIQEYTSTLNGQSNQQRRSGTAPKTKTPYTRPRGTKTMSTNTAQGSTSTSTNGGKKKVAAASVGPVGKPGPIAIAHAEFKDEGNPVGVKLNALYKKGFAYKTIGYRLPVIITQIVDQMFKYRIQICKGLPEDSAEEVKAITGQLSRLKNEVQTNKPIQPLPIRSTNNNHMATPENVIWNDYLTHMALQLNGEDNVRWYNAPWLYVECYLYRRIYDIFISSEHFKNYDYFQRSKQDGFNESESSITNLAEFMVEEDMSLDKVQKNLLDLALWGNRCDLSLSQGVSASHHSHELMGRLDSLKQYILCDDSEAFWRKLKSVKETFGFGAGTSIGYVLDNAGFEMFSDLCFADCLLNYVDSIDIYVKMIPWFVSDALSSDVEWMLDTMEKNANLSLRRLAQRWKGYLETNKWRIIAEPFWTYPHAFADLKYVDSPLYDKLGDHVVLVFKGDLNYRKLVSDINWEKSTAFSIALYTFKPTSVFSLRTLKADTVAGLRPGLGEEMDKTDPEWMVSGQYALLQYADFDKK